MDKKLFQSGHCLDFAAALLNKNINLELALVGSYYWDDILEEETFEASHAVVLKSKNDKVLFDSTGQTKLEDINSLFNHQVDSKIQLLRVFNLEEAESYLGQINKEVVIEAEKFIDKNQLLFRKAIPLNTEKEISEYIDINIKGSYKKFKAALNEWSINELKKGKEKEQIISHIDNAKKLFQKYQNNIKNHEKRYSEKNGELQFDEYYFSINKCKSFEDFSDGIMKITNYNNVLNYAKSFVRSYKDIMIEKVENPNGEIFSVLNTDTFKLFNVLNAKKIDREDLEDRLSRMATFTEANDLNVALKQTLNVYSDTYEYKLKEISESEDVSLLYAKDNKIFVEVNNFNGSKTFGNKWCISSNEDDYYTYLERTGEIDTSRFESNCDSFDEDAIVKGKHIFCWDFNANEEDHNRHIAFTVSSAGVISAAFDSNNDDIEVELEDGYGNITKEDINEAIKKSTTLNDKELIKDHNYSIKALIYPEFLILHSKHPLHTFRKMFENNEIHYLNMTNEINIEDDLFTTSIERYLTINNDEISPAQMLSDALYFDSFIKNYIITKNELKEDFDEDEDEYYYHHEYDEEENSKNIVCSYSVDSIFQNNIINDIFNSLSDIEKQLIYKTHQDTFRELLLEKMQDIDSMSPANHFSGYFYSINVLNSKILTSLSHILLKDNDINENEKTLLTAIHVINNKDPEEHIVNDFFELIKNEKVHINKVINNCQNFSEENLIKIAKTMNDNPHIIKEVCPKGIHELSKHNSILDNINPEVCNILKNRIMSTINFDLTPESIFPNSKNIRYDFPQRFKKLFDLNIIDRDIANKQIDTGRIAYGHLNRALNEEGKQINVIDYICQNEKTIKQKKHTY